MKKKVLTIALAIALIAIMVSGSLAYFTAQDEVTNTFTIGSVEIEIWENNARTDEDQMVFEKPLMPIVNVQAPAEDESYIPKVVKVENTGLNAAYIRVHIAQPVALLCYLELDADATGWNRLPTTTRATVDGVEYIVVTYDYQTAVDPSQFTPELLKGAYLPAFVDLKENADGDLEFCKPDDNGGYEFSGFVAHEANGDGTYTSKTVNVLVAAQAIQTRGFENGTVTAALNAGFGENTNPWQ